MYTNSTEQRHISDHEREAFKKALTIYYSGSGRIVDAFAEVEPGLIDRYYRRKKVYPQEIEAIETEARADAKERIKSELTVFEAQQLHASLRIQRQGPRRLNGVSFPPRANGDGQILLGARRGNR
jgi:hypothetical protein